MIFLLIVRPLSLYVCRCASLFSLCAAVAGTSIARPPGRYSSWRGLGRGLTATILGGCRGLHWRGCSPFPSASAPSISHPDLVKLDVRDLRSISCSLNSTATTLGILFYIPAWLRNETSCSDFTLPHESCILSSKGCEGWRHVGRGPGLCSFPPNVLVPTAASGSTVLGKLGRQQ